MKATPIIAALSLVVGGTVGYFAGKNNSSEADQSATANSRSTNRSVGNSAKVSGSNSYGGKRVRSSSEALSLPGQNNRLQALMDYYANLNVSQFEEEAKKLEELPWSERIMAGYLLFARWGEEDPTAALAYTKTMGFAGMFVSGTVMQSWAAKYPQEAAAYYKNNPAEFRMMSMMGGRRGGRGVSMANTIATEWARQDPEGAMAWAQSLEGQDKQQAMRGVFGQIAKADPAEAAGMLSSITGEAALSDARNTVAREWGSKDWTAAESWIAGLPADAQASATSQALRGLAENDPKLAASKISSLPEGADRDRAMETISRRWAADDPAAAAVWVMENGSEDAQADSMRDVMSNWVAQDSKAALAFVNEQPEGRVRDRAASSYVMSNQSGDIQENLRVAETIGDNRSRHWAIGMTAANWAKQDKEAATEYVDNSEQLSDRAKERIKRFNDGGGFGRRGRR